MNIEKQVVNLGIALRLKELGVAQESHFVWIFYAGKWVVGNRYFPLPYNEYLAAYTVPELAELLGDNLSMIERLLDGRWNAAYSYATGCMAPTMPDALGLLLERVLSEAKK